MSHSTTKEQSSLHYAPTVLSTSPTTSAFVKTEITTTSSLRGDYKGTNFLLMFINNVKFGKSKVELIITTNNTASVKLYSPYQGVNKTVSVTNGVAHVHLPDTIGEIATGLSPRGIHVLSDKPISVVGFSSLNPGCCTSYSFNTLSADMQGQQYNILTFFRTSGDIQSFGILSSFPNTSIVITSRLQQPITILGKTLLTNNNITMKLDQLQCYYYETSVNFDISGLKITGNKPFFVFSGNSKIHFDDWEIAEESIPPSDTWGKNFVVPLIQAVTIYLKIVVNDAENVVNITGKNYSRSFKIINKLQVELPADSYSVTANHPILLAVITKFANSSISPFMSLVPAITQFSNDYIVAGPSIMSDINVPYRHFLSIVIDQKYESGLKMNGNVLQALQETSIALENVKYKCIIVMMSGSSAHKISHVQSNIVFGAIVYGYGHNDAYGYPAGLRL